MTQRQGGENAHPTNSLRGLQETPKFARRRLWNSEADGARTRIYRIDSPSLPVAIACVAIVWPLLYGLLAEQLKDSESFANACAEY
jgi:hypothetical protein